MVYRYRYSGWEWVIYSEIFKIWVPFRILQFTVSNPYQSTRIRIQTFSESDPDSNQCFWWLKLNNLKVESIHFLLSKVALFLFVGLHDGLSKLQEKGKPPALKSEHPALQLLSLSVGSFLPSWIRIQTHRSSVSGSNPDPDAKNSLAGLRMNVHFFL